MSENSIIERINILGKRILPPQGQLYLYGSRARGDARPDSDYDLLVLIPKNHLTPEDYDNYTYPFTELGWKMNQSINPILYTQKEWKQYSFTPFYHNVQQDAIRLY